MSARLRQRRSGSPYQCGYGQPCSLLLLAALVVSSSACGRFGFERLEESEPDSGLNGPRLTTRYDGGSEPGTGGFGGSDPGQGGFDGGNGPDLGGVGGGNGLGEGGAESGRCLDGSRNGDELGVDCGGSSCAPCPCTVGALERLGDPNYPGNDLWSPALSNDGLSLYFGFTTQGYTERLALSTRGNRASAFGQGQPLPSPINEGTEGTPFLSADELSLYFYSRRPGGPGNRDLYVATRARSTDPFDDVTPLSSLNGTGMDHQPEVSPDQLSIYFVSDRSGNVDIWRSTRASIGAAFDPPEAVSELNTSSEEGGITLSSDGLEVIITSNRPGGAGARDLYRATRANAGDPFSNLQPLAELNTPNNEIDPTLSSDGSELYFASNRGGAESNLYRVVRSCPE